MSVEQNIDLVTRYFDTIWNRGEFQREPEFVDRDIVVHAPPLPDLPSGIQGPLAIVGTFRAAFPDLRLTQDLMFGGGDMVTQRWYVRGTHTGQPLFGIPTTGKRVLITGINGFRVADGHIVERWGSMDAMGMMQPRCDSDPGRCYVRS